MIFGLFDLHKKNICSLLPTTVWHEMFLVQMELNTFFSYRIHYMFDCFQKKILIQLYRVKISNFFFFFWRKPRKSSFTFIFESLRTCWRKFLSFEWIVENSFWLQHFSNWCKVCVFAALYEGPRIWFIMCASFNYHAVKVYISVH